MGPGVFKNWATQKDFLILILVYCTLPIFSHAGGLGIAAIVAISGAAGLIGFNPFPLPETLRRVPRPIYWLMLFLVWAMVSSFWSPYQNDNILSNAFKILIGVPIYLACGAVIKMCAKDDKKRQILVNILLFCTLGSSVAILIDQLSGYAITMIVEPLKEGQDPNKKLGDMIQNIGHGTSVLALLVAPVFVLFWTRGNVSKILACLLAVLIISCGIVTGQSASLLATIAAFSAMGFAMRKPIFAVRLSFLSAIIALTCAPLLAWLSYSLSADTKASLPFSWEERVENWAYLYEKVSEHPFIGHGFDAVRTFNESHTIRGYEGRAIVSLHPHNAGLHIWTELGLIGAVLGSVALFITMRYLTASGRLSRPQLIATSGFVMATTIMASFSYGVWQDWWWAIIIFAAAQVFYIKDGNVAR